jgi:hypothetical protein
MLDCSEVARIYDRLPVRCKGVEQRFALPFQVNPERGDLDERPMVELGAEIAPLPRKLTISDRTVQLTPEEYDRYRVLAGEGVDRFLKVYEQRLPKLEGQSREVQQKMLQLAISNGRIVAARAITASHVSSDP